MKNFKYIVIIFCITLLLSLTGCKKKYTVTFDSNGGNSIKEQEVVKGDKIIEPSKPTKYGCEFDGWYVNDEKWNFVEYEVTENIILKAKWILKGTKGLNYKLSDDGKYYIVTGKGTTTESEIIIPIEYNKLPVKEIGEYAFYNCRSLTSIEIPNSVITIGRAAFYGCTSLTSIQIPFVGSTLEGKSNAFFGYIFGATTYLDHSSCVPKSLKKVIITGGKSIGNSAFYECTSIESIEIPRSVTTIRMYAFAKCKNLTSINVNKSNKYYKSIDGNLYTKDGRTLIQYSIGKNEKTFVIRDSVTSIGKVAFYECTSLESIEIPDSVRMIEDGAFLHCINLTIYCEVEAKPDKWVSSWNPSNCPVIWGYKQN